MLFVIGQLSAYARSVHLTWRGYDYGVSLALLPALLVIGLLAPLVSYRRRDALLMLVPIWNLVVIWRIGSRLARIPHRDWPQRPAEIADQETGVCETTE